MIEGLQQISKLKNHDKIALKINGILSELGFKKILYGVKFGRDKDYYDNLTISIYPSLNEDGIDTSELGEQFTTLKGYVNETYMPTFSRPAKEDFFFNDEAEEKIIMGRYYEDRNLFIFNFPLFHNTKLELEDKNECLFWLLGFIGDKCKQLNVHEIDISKRVVNIMVKNFIEQIENEKGNVERNIKDTERYMKDAMSNYIQYERTKAIKEAQLIQMMQFALTGKEKVMKEVEDIKSLKFVKDITLQTDGILINIGEISVNWIDENAVQAQVAQVTQENNVVFDADVDSVVKKVNEKVVKKEEVYMGEMLVKIMPTKISVDVVKRKKIYDEYGSLKELIHPHVNMGDPTTICWGNRKSKVFELLGKFELKKLVYFIYLWAKSYNPSDKLTHIDYWTGKRGKPYVEPVATPIVLISTPNANITTRIDMARRVLDEPTILGDDDNNDEDEDDGDI